MDLASAANESLPTGAWATVSAIDSASLSNLPLEPYFHSDLPRLQRVTVPAFSFVITNQQGRYVLFDLGLRKNWTELSPTAVAEIHNDNLGIDCQLDVRDILEAHNVSIDSVEAIILRLIAHLFVSYSIFRSLRSFTADSSAIITSTTSVIPLAFPPRLSWSSAPG